MRRILIDVTELLGLQLNTGIQRVVREVYAGLAARDDLTVVPVVAIDGRLSNITPAGHDLLAQARPATTAPAFTPRERPNSLGGRIVAKAAHVAFLLTDPFVKKVLPRFPRGYAFVQQRHFLGRMPAMLAPFRQPGHVTLAPGDILLAADTFWTGSEIIVAARWARRNGARVIAIVYDMIPYTHPELAGMGLSRSFARLLRRLLSTTDGVLTISHFSAAAIRQFMAANRLSRPVEVFYLGSDSGRRELLRTHATDADWPAGLWETGTRTTITVGTIEPRKGHDTILAAFNQRWRAGSDDRLVMIGKFGAGDSAAVLAEALTAHPARGRRLFVMNQVGDAMLADAYARADACIMASIVEGFGLPLVEALTAGVPMIASDIPVFREIAGDRAAYFHVGDADDLARVLGEAAERPRHDGDFCWPDWRAATSQFHDRLLALATAA